MQLSKLYFYSVLFIYLWESQFQRQFKWLSLGLDQFQVCGFTLDSFKQSDTGTKGNWTVLKSFVKALEYNTLLKKEIGKPASSISYVEVNRVLQTVGVLKHAARCWAVTNSLSVLQQQWFAASLREKLHMHINTKNEQALKHWPSCCINIFLE